MEERKGLPFSLSLKAVYTPSGSNFDLSPFPPPVRKKKIMTKLAKQLPSQLEFFGRIRFPLLPYILGEDKGMCICKVDAGIIVGMHQLQREGKGDIVACAMCKHLIRSTCYKKFGKMFLWVIEL
ncbi:unnamed protein product [Phytomonas sp. EM1]|nr:unnamed protein product [Phytomonas sp. EM1]|eukprot:CCW60737.1 unnamed protein product [Phytomonas sp. isolate EM1]